MPFEEELRTEIYKAQKRRPRFPKTIEKVAKEFRERHENGDFADYGSWHVIAGEFHSTVDARCRRPPSHPKKRGHK
jgi:hypothetical protein